jgi:hypothetical protein
MSEIKYGYFSPTQAFRHGTYILHNEQEQEVEISEQSSSPPSVFKSFFTDITYVGIVTKYIRSIKSKNEDL